jgi:hypothetical protein
LFLKLPLGGIKFPLTFGIINNVVKIGKILLADEISKNVHVPVRHAVGRENVVVGNYHHLAPIPDFGVSAEFPFENTDGAGTAYIVRHEDIDGDPHIVAGADMSLSGGAGENFFGKRHKPLRMPFPGEMGKGTGVFFAGSLRAGSFYSRFVVGGSERRLIWKNAERPCGVAPLSRSIRVYFQRISPNRETGVM